MAVERSPLAKVDDITLVHMAHSGEDAPCLVWKCPCAVMCHIRPHAVKVAPSSGVRPVEERGESGDGATALVEGLPELEDGHR